MLRIMKYLSKAEIGQMLIALVTIVGQVYFCLLYTSSPQIPKRFSCAKKADC